MLRLLLTFISLLSTQTVAMAEEKLYFEQYGSMNATIMPFYIEIGRSTETTRRTIYVTPAVYTDVVSLVSAATPMQPNSKGFSFNVAVLKDTKAMNTTFVSADVVAAVMRRIKLMFNARHQAVPAFIPAIEQAVASKDRLAEGHRNN